MNNRTFGNEVIGSSGRKSIEIRGLDGLEGLVRIKEKEISLDITQGGRYRVTIRSDGTVSANISRFGDNPALKLRRPHITPEGFAVLLHEVRYGPTSAVHELFSDILGHIVEDVSDTQKELYARSIPHRIDMGVYNHEKNLMRLRIALMDSVTPSQQSIDLIDTPERETELEGMIELSTEA